MKNDDVEGADKNNYDSVDNKTKFCYSANK